MILLIRSLDAVVVGLGLGGIALGLMLARQSLGDRRAALAAGRNGWFLLHSTVGIRDGIAVAMTHIILGGLGLAGLLGPAPPPDRYGRAIGFALGYITILGVVISLQSLNLYDGRRLRRRPSA